jgi:uncharacterized protein
MKKLIISNQDFAQKQLKEKGEFSLLQCERLLEFLQVSHQQAQQSIIYFELTGAKARFSYPSLQLSIKAELPAICQRCLDVTNFSLNLQFNYLINPELLNSDATVTEDENDETDWLEPDVEFDVLALIEDELLMAAPIAPIHEVDCGQLNLQSGEKANPFAVLKGKIK